MSPKPTDLLQFSSLASQQDWAATAPNILFSLGFLDKLSWHFSLSGLPSDPFLSSSSCRRPLLSVSAGPSWASAYPSSSVFLPGDLSHSSVNCHPHSETSEFVFLAQMSCPNTRFVFIWFLSTAWTAHRHLKSSMFKNELILFFSCQTCPYPGSPMSEAWESLSLQWPETINVVKGCRL